jgi:hypothetical protein
VIDDGGATFVRHSLYPLPMPLSPQPPVAWEANSSWWVEIITQPHALELDGGAAAVRGHD